MAHRRLGGRFMEVTDSLATQIRLDTHRQEGRRVVDTAVGILVGLRQCSVDDAFAELVGAAEQHRVALFSIASALVTLASRDAGFAPGGIDAALAAERQWGANYWP
ncbi:MAG: putative RNA-binding protein [Mycobacterium sp.]|nr:putative RNA-binding protein [Mycobacterium sp.]